VRDSESLARTAGVRAAQHLLFWDGNFSNVQQQSDESDQLLDEAYIARLDKFLKELIWMAKVLRYGRKNVAA